MGNLLEKSLGKKEPNINVNTPTAKTSNPKTQKSSISLLEKQLNSEISNIVNSDFNASEDVTEIIIPKKKKEKKSKKTSIEHFTVNQDDVFDEDQFMKEIEILNDEKETTELKVVRNSKFIEKIFISISLVLCVYLLFLIYGLFVTKYEYDSSGKVIPSILTVEEIAEQKEFETFKNYYLLCRQLYEDVLILDYRLDNNKDENYIVLASEYQSKLETVSILANQINGLTLSPEYKQSLNIMMTWIKTDMAVYLQNISSALSSSDSDKYKKAIISKQVVYDNFHVLTDNVIYYSKTIKGVDMKDVINWTTTDYIKKTIGKL